MAGLAWFDSSRTTQLAADLHRVPLARATIMTAADSEMLQRAMTTFRQAPETRARYLEPQFRGARGGLIWGSDEDWKAAAKGLTGYYYGPGDVPVYAKVEAQRLTPFPHDPGFPTYQSGQRLTHSVRFTGTFFKTEPKVGKGAPTITDERLATVEWTVAVQSTPRFWDPHSLEIHDVDPDSVTAVSRVATEQNQPSHPDLPGAIGDFQETLRHWVGVDRISTPEVAGRR